MVPPFLLPIYEAAGEWYGVPWEVLAAINEVESDYGRDLSVSSAGAVGWMQFLPETWSRYAVDAAGRGFADPYNPLDAIFTAARYLSAAGAAGDLSGAIFAYNHASWYVRSVLLRAQLIEDYPPVLTAALQGLMAARFPVSGRVLSYRRVVNGAAVISAAPGSVAVAASDAVVERTGISSRLGRYVVLRDAFGNHYTYSGLGSIESLYPRVISVPSAITGQVPQTSAGVRSQGTRSGPVQAWAGVLAAARGVPAAMLSWFELSHGPRVGSEPASGGSQPALRGPDSALVKERLFAYPSRPASSLAGGLLQLLAADPVAFTASTRWLPPARYRPAPLVPGAVVLAGTALGQLTGSAGGETRLSFRIAPAHQPAAIDPTPILDGWRLEAQTGLSLARPGSPWGSQQNAGLLAGRVLLMDNAQLVKLLFASPRVTVAGCTRSLMNGGRVDRRVLEAIAYLDERGLVVSVAIPCSGSAYPARSATIDAINGSPPSSVGAGAVAERAVTLLLTLPPPASPTSPARSRHPAERVDRAGIELDYPAGPGGPGLSAAQWSALVARLARFPLPVIDTARSSYATFDQPRKASRL